MLIDFKVPNGLVLTLDDYSERYCGPAVGFIVERFKNEHPDEWRRAEKNLRRRQRYAQRKAKDRPR